MSTIVWNISQLDRQTSNGFVTVAHWQATATDGIYSASVYSTCSWTGEPLTAYELLTQNDVLAWVWQSVDKDVTEASLETQIAEQKAPKIATGLPWE
jgi:hypothetical protein